MLCVFSKRTVSTYNFFPSFFEIQNSFINLLNTFDVHELIYSIVATRQQIIIQSKKDEWRTTRRAFTKSWDLQIKTYWGFSAHWHDRQQRRCWTTKVLLQRSNRYDKYTGKENMVRGLVKTFQAEETDKLTTGKMKVKVKFNKGNLHQGMSNLWKARLLF